MQSQFQISTTLSFQQKEKPRVFGYIRVSTFTQYDTVAHWQVLQRTKLIPHCAMFVAQA